MLHHSYRTIGEVTLQKEGATVSIILHRDLNCFYASVEMNEAPELKGKKVAVCGSTENRHGIVLTANYPAKRSGVKTGMANWQAQQACPGLIMIPPHYELYLKYPRFCFLHFGGKGTEFSNSNCLKPLCRKGFPFCHYYTLMA